MLCMHVSAAYEALKKHLRRYQEELSTPDTPTEAIEDLITNKIERFVKEMFSSGSTRNELDEILSDLCFERFLVPSRLCPKIQSLPRTLIAQDKKIDDSVEDTEEDQQEVDPSEPLPPMPPSELKEVLYHSTLCCIAVTYCPTSYSEFFTQNGHHFKAISMSQSDYLEGCLIAIYGNTKGDTEGDTVYIAFRSKPELSDWISQKGYESFEQGEKDGRKCVYVEHTVYKKIARPFVRPEVLLVRPSNMLVGHNLVICNAQHNTGSAT